MYLRKAAWSGAFDTSGLTQSSTSLRIPTEKKRPSQS